MPTLLTFRPSDSRLGIPRLLAPAKWPLVAPGQLLGYEPGKINKSLQPRRSPTNGPRRPALSLLAGGELAFDSSVRSIAELAWARRPICALSFNRDVPCDGEARSAPSPSPMQG